MSKKKLMEDVKMDPKRFYRSPANVIRDRRFSDEERLEILEAWEKKNAANAAEIDQVRDARAELKRKHDRVEPSRPDK